MRHTSPTAFRYGGILVAAAMIWSLAPAGAAAAEPLSPGDVDLPVFEETIEPCCGDQMPVLDQGSPYREQGDARPTHQFFTPSMRRSLKALAIYNPQAPAGVDVGTSGDELTAGADLVIEPSAPNTSTRFEGSNILSETSLGLSVPPDTILAVSPTKVLQGTNTAFQLSNRNGAKPLIINLNDFFNQKGSVFVFDPKVIYDNLSGRFFVVAISQSDVPQSSFLYLAVSKNSNPAGYSDRDWCRYKINARREGAWADFPGLGANENWVAVSVNNFKFAGGNFASPFIYAFDKANLIDNAKSCRPIQSTGFRPAIDPAGTITFTIQPALHYSSNSLAGTPLFFVSTQPLSSSNTYVLWRLKGTTPTLEKVNLTHPVNYTIPPDAPQLGGDDLDSGDMRIQQVAYRNGRIWAVHSTGCNLGPAPSEACIRAIEIQPTDTGGDITFSEIFGSNDWFHFWPGIAVNQAGAVVTTFQRSRANRFLDVAYNGKPAGAEGFDVVRTLKIGQCTLFNDPNNTGVNRTGDYVGVQTDPLDHTAFWISGEYTGQLRGLGCDWKTHIARVNYVGGAAAADRTSAQGAAHVGEDDGQGDGEAAETTSPTFEMPRDLDLLRPRLHDPPFRQ